jgi:hypothetical protein
MCDLLRPGRSTGNLIGQRHLFFFDGATPPIGGGTIDPSVAIATATLGTLSAKVLPPGGGCWMKAPYPSVAFSVGSGCVR